MQRNNTSKLPPSAPGDVDLELAHKTEKLQPSLPFRVKLCVFSVFLRVPIEQSKGLSKNNFVLLPLFSQ